MAWKPTLTRIAALEEQWRSGRSSPARDQNGQDKIIQRTMRWREQDQEQKEAAAAGRGERRSGDARGQASRAASSRTEEWSLRRGCVRSLPLRIMKGALVTQELPSVKLQLSWQARQQQGDREGGRALERIHSSYYSTHWRESERIVRL